MACGSASTIRVRHMTPSDHARIYGVVFAMRRSRVRQAVITHLLKHGPCPAGEISRVTGIDLGHVLGALKGRGRRYAPERSLVGLGLVEFLTDPTRHSAPTLYQATAQAHGFASGVHGASLSDGILPFNLRSFPGT
ncbi:MAG: archaellum operon transcriptional activator EarA family protein [Thermoplasmatota archaeon]